MKYPGDVIIERSSVKYSIRKRGGTVGSYATLVQFAVKLAHAITAHKIQGQTIPKPLKVALGIDSIFEEAQGHVMLSRVQELQQVYIIAKFDPRKLRASPKALKELERMNKVSINANPNSWEKEDNKILKIISLNCAGLKAHYDDIRIDQRVLKADIIHLVEISLTDEEDEQQFRLEGYKEKFIKIGLGKGIATYYDKSKFYLETEYKSDKFQVIKFSCKTLDIINVYRSQSGHSVELLESMEKMIDKGRVTVITGDFNICFIENFSNRMIQGLLGMGFNQLVHEPTHIRGRHIDHIYYLDPNDKFKPTIERYSPYYSDHDGTCIALEETS